jgi:hypothetical protein
MGEADMQRSGSRVQALIGLWILAGLIVVGINGAVFMSLLDEPLAGYSPGVRTADRGFRQYRTLVAAEARKITSGMDFLVSRFGHGVEDTEKPTDRPVPDPPPAVKPAPHPAMRLPTLTGVITRQASDGTAIRLAVMDGRICAVGDRFQNLTIKTITRKGVSLAGKEKSWFLKMPEITYSVVAQ